MLFKQRREVSMIVAGATGFLDGVQRSSAATAALVRRRRARLLAYAKPWFSTYQTVAVRKALEDEIQAMMNGKKKADQAVKDAQKKADELMRPYVEQTSLKLPEKQRRTEP